MPIYEEKKKTKDGQKIYFIRTYITDEFGKRKQITRHNKKEWIGREGYKMAMAEEISLTNKTEVPKQKKITFDKLCQEYIGEQTSLIKESTVFSYYEKIKNHILPYLEDKIICSSAINEWRNKILQSSISLTMKNTCHSIMCNILDFGIKKGYFEQNFEKIQGAFKEKNETVKKDDKNIRYITFEQFQKFISIVDNNDWKTFFIFLYYTGMRKGEVQALTWEDIDFAHKQILVSKNLTTKTFDAPYKITNTKTKENRKIDMSIFLEESLLEYYNTKNKIETFSTNDFVFGGKKPFSRTSIDRYKKKYFDIAKEKYGIQEITIHEFRHSHISLIINEAVKNDLDMLGIFIMLSERMGHTIEVMQQTYMHLFPNIQNKIVDIINNLDKQDQKQV